MGQLPEVQERTLQRAFDDALARVPDKTAYICGDEKVTYAEAHRRALVCAARLTDLGVMQGGRVALMLDNSLDLLSFFFGSGLTNRVSVPVNTAYRGEFLTHVLNNCGATVMVVEGHYVDRLREIAGDCQSLKHIVVRGSVEADESLATLPFAVTLLRDSPDPLPAATELAGPETLMALMYTSGTTGVSKGVQVTHGHFYTYASREDSERPNSDDRILVTLPMFHFGGLGYGAYQSLIAQATSVIQSAFSVSKFWPIVREHRITETFLLGVMAELLAGAPLDPAEVDNTLDYVVMAPLPQDLRAFEERFDVRIGAVYGLSEVGSAMRSDAPDVVQGEVGVARADYEARLVHDDGSDAGEGPGELLIKARSPYVVMQGYQGMPEASADALQDGWVRTGDILRRDAAGHYFFVDRKKDALRRRGENVSSFEVERALVGYPPVVEAAVVGVPSDIVEDEIKAIVTVGHGDSDLDFRDLVRFLVTRLPYFMVPRYFQVVEAIPKTPTGKILKANLRAEGLGTVTWDRVEAGVEVTRTTKASDISDE